MCEQAYNHDLLHKMQLQFILSSGTFKRSGFLSISLTIGYSDCAINAETSVLCKLRAKTHTCTARCFYYHSVSVHVPRLGGGFGGKQVTSIFPASAAALAATCTGRSVPHFTCSPVSVGGCNVEGGGVKQVIFISQPPVTLPLQFTCTVHLHLLGAGQLGGGDIKQVTSIFPAIFYPLETGDHHLP